MQTNILWSIILFALHYNWNIFMYFD